MRHSHNRDLTEFIYFTIEGLAFKKFWVGKYIRNDSILREYFRNSLERIDEHISIVNYGYRITNNEEPYEKYLNKMRNRLYNKPIKNKEI